MRIVDLDEFSAVCFLENPDWQIDKLSSPLHWVGNPGCGFVGRPTLFMLSLFPPPSLSTNTSIISLAYFFYCALFLSPSLLFKSFYYLIQVTEV